MSIISRRLPIARISVEQSSTSVSLGFGEDAYGGYLGSDFVLKHNNKNSQDDYAMNDYERVLFIKQQYEDLYQNAPVAGPPGKTNPDGWMVTAKQWSQGLGLSTWHIGTTADIDKLQKVRYISPAAAHKRITDLNTVGKYATRAGRIFTGADIGLTIGQFIYSKKGYSDCAILSVNLFIGTLGYFKDPFVGTFGMVLGMAETAGAFDGLYNNLRVYDDINRIPNHNAFGTLWPK